jgi:hypothetical protein
VKNQLILGSETFASTTFNEFEEDTYVNSSLHESIRHRAKKTGNILKQRQRKHLWWVLQQPTLKVN